jgi:hypothetical protein
VLLYKEEMMMGKPMILEQGRLSFKNGSFEDQKKSRLAAA